MIPEKNIFHRIYEILALPLLWLSERKPMTQTIIIIGFFCRNNRSNMFFTNLLSDRIFL